jgi:hypothetical protein
LIEHDRTDAFREFLGNKQLGVGGRCSGSKYRNGRSNRRTNYCAPMARCRADHHHKYVWVQPPTPPCRARQNAVDD